VTTTGMMNLF